MKVAEVKKGDRFQWSPLYGPPRIVVCSQTDSETRCGPVFSDPETGSDILRVPSAEQSDFDLYFRKV